jgi:hypothetical protein
MYSHYGRRFHLHDASNTYMDSPEQGMYEQGVGFDKKKVKRWARISIVRKKNREYINQLLEDNYEGDTSLLSGYDYPRPLQPTQYEEEEEDDLFEAKLNARRFFRRECRRIVTETVTKIKEDETVEHETPSFCVYATNDGK